MKNWYSIQNKSEGVLDISIHDEIGMWGISAKDFINDLRSSNAKAVNLSIHSPGGSVIDGLAMYNALVNYPAKISAKVEGLAASAASFILMAADHIEMPEDSFIMIHNAWGMAIGDAEEMRETAAVVDKLQDSIINIYQKRTGLNDSEIREMMSAETWLDAAEALDLGFIDSISDAMKVAAKLNQFNKHFKSLPVSNSDETVPEITSIKDFERFLRDAGGFSRGLAKALTSQAKNVFQRDAEKDDSQTLTAIESALMRLNNKLG